MKSSEHGWRRFTREDVEIVETETAYQGFLTVKKYRFRHPLFTGGMSRLVQREVIERDDAVAVVPWDPVRDQIILIEQIRIATLNTSDTPWRMEIIAGMIEAGECEQQVARREAQEEAGLSLGQLHFALSYLSSPGGLREKISVFIGETDSRVSDRREGFGLQHEDEDIRISVVSREQAYQMVEQGRIDNAATVIGLQWLQLHYKTLKQQWGY